MKLSEAVGLIVKGVSSTEQPQQWCDLGAGNGLFTAALSTLLKKGSVIYAVDKDVPASQPVPGIQPGVEVIRIAGDFTQPLPLPERCDGILMANSLHYVKHPATLLQQLTQRLNTAGRLLIVEYDTEQANHWVPYPVSYEKLKTYCAAIPATVHKLGSAASVYHADGMYAALITL